MFEHFTTLEGMVKKAPYYVDDVFDALTSFNKLKDVVQNELADREAAYKQLQSEKEA